MQIINEISEFKNIQENWDGYGASKTDEQCISNAIKIISLLKIPNSILEEMDTYPNTNGTVTIEYSNLDNRISIDVGKSSISYYTMIKSNITYNNSIQDIEKEIPKIYNAIRTIKS